MMGIMSLHCMLPRRRPFMVRVDRMERDRMDDMRWRLWEGDGVSLRALECSNMWRRFMPRGVRNQGE